MQIIAKLDARHSDGLKKPSSMRPICFALLALLALIGCDKLEKIAKTTPAPAQAGAAAADPADKADSLTEARKGFQTKLARQEKAGYPPPQPPAKLFQIVKYDAPGGKYSAYLTPDPQDGKKHPAIIWITGGDCNSIDDGSWKEGKPDNDQSASAFRKSGTIMMFPALRGGNDNPGVKEGFLGEVDDVLAAAKFLAEQKYVDADRMYLGGHSTGGTLALLVAESTDRFRAVFSFGPVDDVSGYGPEFCPFDASNAKEVKLRSPGYWLSSIKTPTFVLEGTRQGNIAPLQNMAKASKNPNLHFLPVKGATHFSILFPTTRLIADKIAHDDGATCNIAITEAEVNKPFGK